jgi:hypothetical protein
MQKWEYKVEYIVGEIYQIEAALNSLGGQGWELVVWWGESYYLFKRPRT